MASMTLQAATSSSTPRWRYDVFLNFRGEDTRESFTDHLYAALIEKGLVVFRDNEKLERGKDISQELWKAIQESQYAVVVVSTNYAFSKWCLRELTKILECRSEVRLTVLPVFYHVDPSEVRNQKGSFAEAFAKHIDDSQVGEEQIKRWRAALKEVGNLAGWHIRDRSEATIVKEICGNIVNGLNYNLPNISQGLVGIESRVKEVMTLLCISTDGKDDVRCVGICGMGGIGKTTLAKTVYESVSSFPLSSFFPFDAHCFIADVKDKTRKKGLEYVQEQLISKILSDTQIKIWDDYEGSNVIAKRACQKRVFVVLDDIDETKQLEALAKSRSWFAQGSRIIVTSRNRSLFNTVEYDVCSTFEVELLNDNEALQLFSLKAFKKNYPEENFVELSKDIVKIAAGLPLALEVFGASLYKKDINKWESTRDLLKARSQAEVLKKLEISFDGLELDLQRELFLDIACFFNGKKVDNVMDMLDRFDYHPRINIDVLEEKSLLKIKNGQFWMHELLEQMGKEIVYCENSKKPGKRSRLWHPKDVVEVLNHDTGTDAIETIFLELAPRKFKQINFEAFSKMINLRMLEVSYKDNDDDLHVMKWYGDPTKLKLSDKLCAMEWFGYPLEYLPTNFQPKNLVELKISHSCIKQLWGGSLDQRVEDMVAWGPTRGSKIPDWFNWRTTSLSGSIQSRIDLTSDGVLEVWWGCVLFIVYEVHEFGSCQRKRQKQNFNEDGNSDSRIFDGSNPTSPKFDCQLQVNENGPKISLVFCVPEVLSTGLNGAWMFIKLSCFGEPQRDLNRWNYLGASIITNNLNVEVKECGAHLVRYYDLSETAKELSRISLHSLDSESLKSLCSSSMAVLGPIKGKD